MLAHLKKGSNCNWQLSALCWEQWCQFFEIARIPHSKMPNTEELQPITEVNVKTACWLSLCELDKDWSWSLSSFTCKDKCFTKTLQNLQRLVFHKQLYKKNQIIATHSILQPLHWLQYCFLLHFSVQSLALTALTAVSGLLDTGLMPLRGECLCFSFQDI